MRSDRTTGARTNGARGWLVAALAPLALAAACRAPDRAALRPAIDNLVLVTIDTLRADHVGANGYARATTPNLDRLARESAVFHQAIAQSSWTRASMASLLTGLYPTTVGLTCHNFRVPKAECDLLPGGVVTLAEALRDSGFRTASIVANINVDPVFGFDQGFDEVQVVPAGLAEHDPEWRVHDEWFLGTTRAVSDRALEWLASRPAERRFLLNLHYLDPHDPYDPPQSLRSVFADEPCDCDPRSREAIALYDAEIHHVDQQLARVLDELERSGLAGRTAVVVVADHGEEFHEHGGVHHGFTMYEEQIRVPLLMRLPGLTDAGPVIDGQVRLLDVMPTVLEALGVEAPPGLQGRSLLPTIRGVESDAPPALSEWGYRPLVSWREPPWKLIYDIETETGRLFHLERDPGEREDLAGREARVARRLTRAMTRTLAAALEAGRDIERGTGDVPLEPGQLERLRALGYVDGG